MANHTPPKSSHYNNRTSKPRSDVGYTPMRRKEFTTIFLRRMEEEWLPLIDLMLDQAYKGNTKVLLYLVDYCLESRHVIEVEDPAISITCVEDARALGADRLNELAAMIISKMN